MYIYIYIYDVYTIIMTLHILQFFSQPSSICLWHIVSLEWMVFNCFYVRKHLFHGSLPTPSVCPFRIQIRQSMTAEAWSHLQIFQALLNITLCVCSELLSGREFEDEENMAEAVEILTEFVKLKSNQEDDEDQVLSNF